MKLKLLTLPFFLIFANIYAQKLNYEMSDNASKMFALENYKRGKELYRDLYKKDSKNIKNKYHFGVCLIHSYERNDGIKLLESIASNTATPTEVWFHLARAYHLENRYDKAIHLYKKYLTLSNNSNLIEKSNRNIKMCENAKILIKSPLNIEFEQIGKYVNSKDDEYTPLTTPDESILIYTTRREGTTGRIYDLQGYYTSDIYIAKYKYGKWSKARSIGSPNSYGNEKTAGISANGKYVLYYVNNPKSKNNLQLSEKSRSSYKKSTKIDSEEINLKSSNQSSAVIDNEANYLIFSSDRDGGFGGFDLYLCKKLPNGKWGSPENLGNTINTPYDDVNPYLSDNSTQLYFSSEGHNSIGGFDIFKSTIDLENQKYETPKNIGYPLNSTDDNMSISFSENKKFAYISAYRNDSEGNLDIYRINFKDTEPSYTTIKGYVLDSDSNIYKTPLKIEVFNKNGGDLYGIYEVNPKKGSYIMILPPNKYEINIEIPEKGYFKKDFIVEDRNKYRPEITKNINITFEAE